MNFFRIQCDFILYKKKTHTHFLFSFFPSFLFVFIVFYLNFFCYYHFFFFSCSGMFRNVPECSMFRVLSTANELSGNQRNRMYCLSENGNSCDSSKSRRIHLFERNIVENSEVSLFFIQNSGENSLLNERSKTLMLEVRNKYRLKRNRLKKYTPLNALQITLKQ